MAVVHHLRCGTLFLVLFATVGGVELVAQTEIPAVQPYAGMVPGEVAYRGPGRAKNKDLRSDVVHIGLLLPMRGTRAPEGKLLLQAAQLAIDTENKNNPLPNGQRFELAVGDESGPWGQASSAMVGLIMEKEAVALITSTDGNIAHQAEQIANKVGIPVVTLSSDPTTTRINIPWIFRVGPSDVEQARIMAGQIYGASEGYRVLLVTESSHDGRIGGDEFMKAAASLRENPPERFKISPESPWQENLGKVASERKPDAVVIWTGSMLAKQLLEVVRQAIPATPIYLCQKAADFLPVNQSDAAGRKSLLFTVGTAAEGDDFAERYLEKTGIEPGIAARQTREAVRVIVEAVRRVGANRVRVRDRLVANATSEPMERVVSFDQAGNAQGKANVISVEGRAGKSAGATPN